MLVNSLNSGGAEKQMLWIARTLVENDIPCAVVELTWSAGNARLRELIEIAAEVGVEFVRATQGESYGRRWLFLKQFIKSHSSAVVWTWGFRSDFAILATLWLGGQNRWICSLRTANFGTLRSRTRLVRACAAKRAAYVVNTMAAQKYLEAVCPGLGARTHVLYNFVPETRKEPLQLPPIRPAPLRIVMLGNIDLERKGYNLVLDLGESFLRRNDAVEIHVAGRPDSEGKFVREIARRELGKVVIYHGETGTPDLFLRSGHCYLLTSPFEGMPNALLEAASLALPVISTKVGDLESIAVDGVQMRLISPGDLPALQAGVASILGNWREAVEMGKRGRQWCLDLFDGRAVRTKLMQTMAEIGKAD